MQRRTARRPRSGCRLGTSPPGCLPRQRAGGARHVDVALTDSLLALPTYQAGRLFATGEVPSRDGNYHATIVPYGTFAVADGFINVAVATDVQFQRFCEVIDAPELAGRPGFAHN